MLDIIDWSKERPRHNDLDRYIVDVQKAAPKTKFVYHVGMSGSSSMLKELFIDLSQQGQVHLVQKPLDQSKNRTFAYLCQLTLRGIREKAPLNTKFLERKLEQFEDLKTEIARFEEKLGEIQERQHG